VLEGNVLGPELFNTRSLLDPVQLIACGRAMGALRTIIRGAQPTPCHDYIARLHEAGRLLRCYTQNVDGLQTRGRPDMANVVLELHGSLGKLSCHRCGKVPDTDAQVLDECLLKDGFVECKKCGQRGEILSRAPYDGLIDGLRIQGERIGSDIKWELRRLPPGLLMPEVLYNEGSCELECDGMNMDELEQADGSASLLLVIGTSISTDGAAKLVRSLARKVRGSGGTVMYIDRASLPNGKWAEYFDVHLRTEIDAWALDASRHLEAVSLACSLCGDT
jgi:NAD-dependent histone deacetylase SIR2